MPKKRWHFTNKSLRLVPYILTKYRLNLVALFQNELWEYLLGPVGFDQVKDEAEHLIFHADDNKVSKHLSHNDALITFRIFRQYYLRAFPIDENELLQKIFLPENRSVVLQITAFINQCFVKKNSYHQHKI